MQLYVIKDTNTDLFFNFRTNESVMVWHYATIFANIREVRKFLDETPTILNKDNIKICVVQARLTDKCFPTNGIDDRNGLMYDEPTINNT